MQIVTEQDVQPYGWRCEGCGSEFQPGDMAYGVLVALTSDGTPIESDFRCVNCWVSEVSVP